MSRDIHKRVSVEEVGEGTSDVKQPVSTDGGCGLRALGPVFC